MRVLVCSDRVGDAGPTAAGAAVARAFVEAGRGRTQAAVVPLAASGPDLIESLDALGAPGTWVSAPDAQALGEGLRASLGERPGRVYADLTAWEGHGPGAAQQLLAGVGAGSRALEGLPSELASMRELVAGVDLVGVLPHGEADAVLLGVQGVSARTLYDTGAHPSDVAARDAEQRRLAEALGVEDAPGLGAAGGAGLAIAGLGGRLADGVTLCRTAAGVDRTLAQADLAVVAVDAVTTGNFGGPVLLALASACAEASTPCLAIARVVDIATRELRRHGVEAAQALGGGTGLTASELTGRARTIAASWTW